MKNFKNIFFLVILFSVNSVFTQSPGPVKITINKTAAVKYSKNLLGANSHFGQRPYGYKNPECINLTGESGVTMLRYPGGTLANYFDWENGCFLPLEKIKSINPSMTEKVVNWQETLDKYHQGRETLADHIEFMKKTGVAQSSWVLNILTGSPEMSAAWLKHNLAENYPADYWELGNEYYLKGYKEKYPDSTAYLLDAKKHALAMRAIKKNIQIGIVASPARSLENMEGGFENIWISENPDVQWNIALSKDKFYDAIIVHDYAVTPVTGFNKLTEDEAHAYFMARNMEYFPKMTAYYTELFGKDKPIWLTEYNIHPVPFTQTMKKNGSENLEISKFYYTKSLSHGMYIADWLLSALGYCGRIEMAHIHVLSAPFYWGLFQAAMPEEENAEKAFIKNIGFYIMQFFSEAFKKSSDVIICTISGSKNMKGALSYKNTEFKSVRAAAFIGSSKSAVIIINKDKNDTAALLDMPDIPRQAEMHIITSDHLIEGFGQEKSEAAKYGPSDSGYTPSFIFKNEKIDTRNFILPGKSVCLILF
ncbi:MAG: hypothetical protein A2096_17830 [Spirochaetes bacterium GWF1_41_5]|nr:MAG: hypothetical protein A2096_17830 [Spirochaetes bacterium GWF1_41_5]